MSSFAGAEDLLRHLTGELDNFEQIAQYLLPQPGDLPACRASMSSAERWR